MQITNADLSNDVNQYLILQRSIVKDFLGGVIKLGEYLSNMKDKYGLTDNFDKFLSEIKYSKSTAFQYIKLYSYAKTNLQELLNANFSGWSKLQDFLYLPDALKKEFLQSIEGQELSNKEFKDKTEELKNKHKKQDINEEIEIPEMESSSQVEIQHKELEEFEKMHNSTILDFEDIVEDASLVDTKFMAKQLLKELSKSGNATFSDSCLVLAETVLSMEKLQREINKKDLKKALSTEELEYWSIQLKAQLLKLELALNNITN